MSGPEYKEREIDGETYKVRLLGTSDAIEVGEKLSSIFLPLVAAYQEMREGITENFYSEVASHLIIRTKDVDVKNTIKKLLYETYIGSHRLTFTGVNDEMNYENYFSGKLSLLFKVVGAALEFNYPEVFSYVSSVAKDLQTLLSEETTQGQIP